MRISYNPLHQNWHSKRPAQQFIQEEMELLLMTEELGFDLVMPPEHHFDEDYSACPDNFLTLAYLAARTERIELALSAIILPWNDPLRVVERLSVLDHLSKGRVIIGFGRGLARLEYVGMGVPMGESRERFDEAWEIVIRGIRTGVVEADTKHYHQPRVEVVPTPRASMADRFLSVGMSQPSAERAGEIGADLLMFTSRPIEEAMPLLTGYRERFRAVQGAAPPPPAMVDFVYVHEDAEVARAGALKYAGRYFESMASHYAMDGTHFGTTKGYEAYAQSAKLLREGGMRAAAEAWIAAQAGIGTPEQVLANYRRRMEVAGPFHAAGAFFYGGMTLDEGKRNTTLFAQAVMPGLRRMFEEATAREDEVAVAT